ncbi:hypothetical protein H257_19075 [Aphanomyces astaci]|uniref:Chromo domain-containing protein n=1 Tax=Aphanomyces astaci TaxID=112090 RepID=W4F927_APHAT|nr:hypothetical protein H257_19075 [Aphanomyces astaci]ETV63990.1 hypothetical protein H257_19075 [Aphanomyces astaci]|eukprot:XP_009846527.1 hypothetical protein H257_19075 [Aphanomyces astaci]
MQRTSRNTARNLCAWRLTTSRKHKLDRRTTTSVEFNEGDYAMLATRNIPLKHAQVKNKNVMAKLVPRFIGPFKIQEVVNANAMWLKLPRSMRRLHDVFNVDRLKHHVQNPERFQGRPIPKVTPIILDDSGNELHIVEALLKQRQFNRKKEYLVQWNGLPEHEATRELEGSIKHVSHFKRLLEDSRSIIKAAKSTTGGECNDGKVADQEYSLSDR